MRTNRACPQYQLNAPPPPVNVALTQEQENEISKQMNDEVEDLVNVEGTKVKISGKLFKVGIVQEVKFLYQSERGD